MKTLNMIRMRFFYWLPVLWLFSSCVSDNLQELSQQVLRCDSVAAVSYQTDVIPLLQTSHSPSTTLSCYYCHSQSTSGLGGGNILDSYDNLRVYVDNGQLLCAIQQTGCAGAEPMPDGGEKLPDSLIAVIETWICQGAPNN